MKVKYQYCQYSLGYCIYRLPFELQRMVAQKFIDKQMTPFEFLHEVRARPKFPRTIILKYHLYKVVFEKYELETRGTCKDMLMYTSLLRRYVPREDEDIFDIILMCFDNYICDYICIE